MNIPWNDEQRQIELGTRTINLTTVVTYQSQRYQQICIVGLTSIGRTVVGYQPFIVGIDLVGKGTI